MIKITKIKFESTDKPFFSGFSEESSSLFRLRIHFTIHSAKSVMSAFPDDLQLVTIIKKTTTNMMKYIFLKSIDLFLFLKRLM